MKIKLFEELSINPKQFLSIKSFVDPSENADDKYYGENDYGVNGYPYVLKIRTTVKDISSVCDNETMNEYLESIIDNFMKKGGNVILYKESLRTHIQIVLAGLLTKYPYTAKTFKNNKWKIISFYEKNAYKRTY